MLNNQLFVGRLRLGAGEDFLKSRVVPERVPFPARPQIGKADAVVGVIDGKRGRKQALNFGKSSSLTQDW
ncbi:MAG: hypothetical protein DME84_10380 [Verrucomicrobia bacterium]|nr:MAG: hypothetical protein DME84_10380 [Verrucomicrobiota bacterium]